VAVLISGTGPSRTLMRTPVVKRQTTPERGFFAFFPPSRSWRRQPWVLCADLLSLGWCSAHAAAPNPYGGSIAIAVAMAERLFPARCALATYLYPHAVLLKRRAAHRGAPVRSRCGGGAAPKDHPSLAPVREEWEPASKHRRRVRATRRCAHGRSSTHGGHCCRAQLPGCAHRDPVRPQACLLHPVSYEEPC
jgi:hypothetical protein